MEIFQETALLQTLQKNLTYHNRYVCFDLNLPTVSFSGDVQIRAGQLTENISKTDI